MCKICRLGQRHLQSQRPTSLLDTSQFSTLVVTDRRRDSISPTPQPSELRELSIALTSIAIPMQNAWRESGDRQAEYNHESTRT